MSKPCMVFLERVECWREDLAEQALSCSLRIGVILFQFLRTGIISVANSGEAAEGALLEVCG